MIIHRPKLRWSPKIGHIMHRRICPSIRDRRWREAVNAVTLWDDNRPKIKNLVCWGGCNCTRSGRIPEQVWMHHRPATGTGPVNFCRCERNTNEWNGTGMGPEWDRNANRNRCEHGHSVVDRWSTSRDYDVVLRRKWQPLPVLKYRGMIDTHIHLYIHCIPLHHFTI